MPSACTSAGERAPTSRNTSSRGVSLVRSSTGVMCGLREPLTAITSPFSVRMVQAWLTRLWSSQPPMRCIFTMPSGVTYLTTAPTSSMCAASMMRGLPAGPFITPMTEPSPSVLTSRPAARNSRARMARTGPSNPAGPGASESSRSKSRTRSELLSCAVAADAVSRQLTRSARAMPERIDRVLMSAPRLTAAAPEAAPRC